ncbi:hypothetical protein AGDE_02479 [Angomonas deanei]|nr:hypothetical protein AGDE_02479 [Angomonas deanei]|eukprot:EPY41445.1 hypothetical protein AGDE_02479 [Angomonas deanei]
MALSSQWGQSVVVRADPRSDVVVHASPNSKTAKAYAAAGNPIIVRPRDPEHFQDIHPNGPGSGTTDGTAPLSRALVTTLVGRDISETFWIPDSSKGEMGLLEMLFRRGVHNKNNILLQSRPMQELQFNYSTVNGNNIDLSHNCFRLSKTAMAVQQMDMALGEVEEEHDGYRSSGSSRGGATVSMTTRDFKHSIRASLQAVQQEDYYLVKYRDYSAWATSHYKSLAKNDTYFGKRYVEQCLAVHVGREPGEIILITDEQFLLGVDILQRQLMNEILNIPTGRPGSNKNNAQSYSQYQMDLDYCALNADQFRSLGAVLGDGMRPVLVQGEEIKKRKEEEEVRRSTGRDHYEAPAWYDWSPAAINKRVHHQMAYYYTSVGKLAVQALVLGTVGYIAYQYVKGVLPAGAEGQYDPRDRRGGGRRGGGGRGNGGRRGGYDYDDDYRPGLLRSIMLGPKEVFDYVLAPKDY